MEWWGIRRLGHGCVRNGEQHRRSVPVSGANLSGDDPARRLAYLGAAGTSGSGLFRIDDTVVTTLSSTAKVNSVAVNAAGDQLAAGGYDTNDVWRVANPATANSSSVSPVSKRPGLDAPGVNEKVVLAFAGANLFAGCSGAESAVSVSANGGQSFRDVGLVDSVFAPIDFTMSGDGTKMYVASYNAGVLSLWRKATVWERVLTWVRPASDFVVRAAPEDFDVVYVAERLTSGNSFNVLLERRRPNSLVSPNMLCGHQGPGCGECLGALCHLVD